MMVTNTSSNSYRYAMNQLFNIALGCALTVALCPAAQAQVASRLDRIAWEHGPAVVQVGDQATLNLPESFVFTHATGARKFLEIAQNPPDGDEVGVLAPEDLSWFAILRFSGDGHIREDEKDSLHADSILASFRQGTEESNEERKRRGWSTVSILGWVQAPHYDDRTHNLEYSLRGRQEDGEIVNHYTRILGRRGVMLVDFVTGMDNFQTQLVAFRQAMSGFSYTSGNDYLAFVQGDKVAQYGLTGLIVGGAAATAAQTGLFKYLWKLIVAVIVGMGALLKKLFSPCQPERQGLSTGGVFQERRY